MRKTVPFSFLNPHGETLAGFIDMPTAAPWATGVFGPCFTCTKESHAAAKVCRALAERGIAMLRFDTTGIGGSEGDVGKTNFTTRVQDLQSAWAALGQQPGFKAPSLLVGHSFSGTAALSAAQHLPGLELMATIGSPSDPQRTIDKYRLTGVLTMKEDKAEINVLGRPFLFETSFINDLEGQEVPAETAVLPVPLLIFHAPADDIVDYNEAEIMKERAGAKATLIPLDPLATHLLNNRGEDAEAIADILARRLSELVQDSPPV